LLTLIKNAEAYAPEYLGKKDVLLADSKIILIEDCIDHVNTSIPIHVVDAAHDIIAPGFIDSHVHIIGGGGEGGYKTRTPELMLTDATTAGVTTIVGVLGTDGTTRRMESLLAKARGLEEEGISCFIHTGSYQIPVKTLTTSIEEDLILIDKIIGVGEIAISDHRSSEPTFEELVKAASAARNGGILSGKAGILEVHVGDGKRKLSLLNQIADETDLPIRQFHPTHINRNEELFKEGIQFEYLLTVCDENEVKAKDVEYRLSSQKEEHTLHEVENESVDLIELQENHALLEMIKQCNDTGKAASRKWITQHLKGFTLTEQQVRNRLDVLEEKEYIIKRRGRAGTKITEKGLHYLYHLKTKQHLINP
jgi:isoaspartyl dipeptidase IadA